MPLYKQMASHCIYKATNHDFQVVAMSPQVYYTRLVVGKQPGPLTGPMQMSSFDSATSCRFHESLPMWYQSTEI